MLDFLRFRWPTVPGELCYALRSLRRDPVFSATALLILGLGSGAHTALVAAVQGLLLAPLPYPEPERLVSVYELREEQGEGEASRRGVALDTLPAWREVEGLEHLAGYRLRSFGLQTAGGRSDAPESQLSEVEVVQVGMTTAGLFRTLGVEPRLGRGFTAEEEQSDLPVVVIGHGLWRRFFAGEPDVLGKCLWLNGKAHTILGVLPAEFRMVIRGRVPDAYIPISHADYGGSRSKRALEVVARRRPGVDLTGLQAELSALGERLAGAWPMTHDGLGIGAESLDTAWRGANRRPLSLLLGGASLLLIIVCANVAGLMLARSVRHRRRRAIRAALGAGGLRLALPTLLEGALIGLGGSLAGLWVAKLALDGLPLALPVLGGAAPIAGFDLDALQLSAGSAMLASALALSCGLLFGAWPAWRLRRRQPASDLGVARSPNVELTRSGSAVVVTQVALGTLLLLAGGLLGRSFVALLQTDPGFDAAGVTSFGLGLPETRYDTEPKVIRMHRELHRELADLPEIDAVGAVARRPLVRGFRVSFEREGEPSPGTERPTSAINVVSQGYFDALRIPLLAGRLPDWNDDTDAPRVLVVNDAFRRAHFGGTAQATRSTDVLGRRLRLSWWSELTARGTPWEIVGLVGDVRQASLDVGASPEIYLPFSQYPAEGATYLLRSSTGESVSAQRIAAVVGGLDPDLQRISPGDAQQWAGNSLADRRLALLVVTVLGLVALLTTTLGVYAHVATNVASRRGEMAVRRALGARPDQISSLVIRRSLKLVSLGFILGGAVFGLLAPGARHLLYGVGPGDPLTFVGIWALLAFVAFLASAVPASKVAREQTRAGWPGKP
ncbi:MAG: ABC transporter permease [Acidobacteriota bacterium]